MSELQEKVDKSIKPEHGKSVDYCRLIERCVDKQFFCAAGERKTNCGVDMREES